MLKLLDYFKINAQKAYREIIAISESPCFLFSNDPELSSIETKNNYYYIHGFNRLIKHNKIEIDRIVWAFAYLEDELEKYLIRFYKDKKFVLTINADIQIPAFTLLVKSYHNEMLLTPSPSIQNLVEWYKTEACFTGLTISETQDENETEDEPIDSYRSNVKVICT
ncbi:hypothetical protein ACFO9Q_11100 [Paenibacillus sp. GCM10023252]|uniref:hypothetical protein n=1 Tax=Paenibacillus sp. GCM10023252 TaxID=3252649 RepID=UPI003607B0BF